MSENKNEQETNAIFPLKFWDTNKELSLMNTLNLVVEHFSKDLDENEINRAVVWLANKYADQTNTVIVDYVRNKEKADQE